MKAFLLKVLNYFQYPSTYSSIVALITLAGVKIAPGEADAIATAGVALYSAIHLFFSDADVTKPVVTPPAK